MEKEKKPRIMKDDENNPIYLNEHDHEVEAYREGLFDYLYSLLSRMKVFTEMLPDDKFSEYGFISEVLINDSERKLEALCTLFDDSIGKIEVDTPTRQDQWRSDGDLPIGVILNPIPEPQNERGS